MDGNGSGSTHVAPTRPAHGLSLAARLAGRAEGTVRRTRRRSQLGSHAGDLLGRQLDVCLAGCLEALRCGHTERLEARLG